MTNTMTILAIVVLVGFGIQSAYACTEGNVQHWTNIFVNPLAQLQHSSEPTIVQVFWLPIPTMGSELVTVDSANEKVADRLNELGYFVNDPTPRPVEENDIDTEVGVGLDIEGYSTICINGVQQMIGGMLLQPDAMTLALAYGIANSVWMAPLVIGIGAGIYLTKSKWKR